ncbi:MAG TPA: cell wall-binding repeat-containing protein [Candidatus Limnocylindria bacterium]|nr:cell wall-binding repeat-containing protein [Candidatus Limnocylindria bacterium]
MPAPASAISSHVPRRSATIGMLLSVVLLLSALGAAPAQAADPLASRPVTSPVRSGPAKGTRAAPESQPTGRLIVQYRPGLSQAEHQRIRDAEGLQLLSTVPSLDMELVEPGPQGTTGAIQRLSGRRDVLFVEPEYRRSHFAGPTGEPQFGQQWALRNTGQTVNGFKGIADVDMNVPEAWSVTTGRTDLVVAVIDDGVDITHPDLAARIWSNPGEIAANGLDDDGNGFVDDVNGWDFCNDDASVRDSGDFHGTHVAGSIAASGNAAGIAGVAPNVKIMPVKFLDEDQPECGEDFNAVAAIEYAVAEGADIINASWGGSDFSASLRAAIAAAPQVLVVAAAGNSNSNNDTVPVYPASYDLGNILSVAAIHNEGHLSGATNFGPTSVDLSAPGEDILSTLPGNTYGLLSGTSMAAANTTGVAALAASARTSLLSSGSQLRQHLIRTARALPSTLGWVASPRLIDARGAVVSRPDVVRLSGADRYATAAAISRSTYVPHVPYVFVATGRDFPDALAGGALAAQVGAPLLLTSTSSIPSATLTEIKRLKPIDIVVLGGAAVISEGVVQALRGLDDPTIGETFRLAGADRYATAAAISTAGFGPGVPTVFIATGTNFPDALAGAPASATLGGPLLLTAKDRLPTVTRTALFNLKPQRIVILGGTAVVSGTVAAQLDEFTTGPVHRWSGADRYATAAAVAAQAFPTAGTAFVASGIGFPDALAGGPPGGASLGPLLTTTPSSLPTSSRQQLQRLKPVRIFVLGGTSVVSDTVIIQIKAAFP